MPDIRRSWQAPVLAGAADVTGIVIFCAVGRRSHTEGLSLLGIWHTAWPFLCGASFGWLTSRGWVQPLSVSRTGIPVWVSTVLGGMLLRKLTSQGTAPSFIVVASLFTALVLLGWRLAASRVGAASKH